jgi:hypothetical protein
VCRSIALDAVDEPHPTGLDEPAFSRREQTEDGCGELRVWIVGQPVLLALVLAVGIQGIAARSGNVRRARDRIGSQPTIDEERRAAE